MGRGVSVQLRMEKRNGAQAANLKHARYFELEKRRRRRTTVTMIMVPGPTILMKLRDGMRVFKFNWYYAELV